MTRYIRWYDLVIVIAGLLVAVLSFWAGVTLGGEPIRVPVTVEVAEPPTAYVATMPGCGPCEQLAPLIRILQDEGYRVYTWNPAARMDRWSAWGLSGTPTIQVIQGGREVGRRVGYMPIAELRVWFQAMGLRRSYTSRVPTPANSPSDPDESVLAPAGHGAAPAGQDDGGAARGTHKPVPTTATTAKPGAVAPVPDSGRAARGTLGQRRGRWR